MPAGDSGKDALTVQVRIVALGYGRASCMKYVWQVKLGTAWFMECDRNWKSFPTRADARIAALDWAKDSRSAGGGYQVDFEKDTTCAIAKESRKRPRRPVHRSG